MFGLNSTIAIGLLRHILTALGGVLVAKGYLTTDLVNTIIGALISLAGVGFSVVDKVQSPPRSVVQPAPLGPVLGGAPTSPASGAAANPGVADPTNVRPAGQPSWVPPQN